MDEEKIEFNIDDVVVGDEPLADGLDSQPAAESKSELASKVPNSESAEHDQDVATKEHTDEPAHLFTRCIECKRTEWATIGKTYVPISLVPSGKRYEAACLMVMCGCSAPKEAHRFGFSGLDEYTDMFKGMKMNKEIMESLIAGTAVYRLTLQHYHTCNSYSNYTNNGSNYSPY